MSLLPIVKRQIEGFGPLSIADYMTLCLLHPDHGYYTTATPFGRTGDFVTAPEISQMFGEMIGLALAQSWLDQGAPSRFCLAELGPGRGSLMADILRVGKSVPGFLAAAEVWLVEASPALQKVQGDTLRGANARHVDQITALPDLPLFLIANEFFDALPIRQYQRTKTGWRERVIGLKDNELHFGLGPEIADLGMATPDRSVGELLQTAPAASAIMAEIDRRIASQGGAALIIDYGDQGIRDNTFQAVQAHQKVSTLTDPGRADLTAHVDFQALAEACVGVTHSALTPQGVFLERLGITSRATELARGLTDQALENHIAAHRRLTHPEEMGALFKVLALWAKDAPPIAGVTTNDA